MRRDQERYARAMDASEAGFCDWIVADDTIYTSNVCDCFFGAQPHAGVV